MTKLIRIENADTSNHKVVVEVWDGANDYNGNVPQLSETIDLNSPTQLISQHIWGNRYLVIREVY